MSAIHDAFPHLLPHFPDPPQPGVFPFEDIFQISLETQTSPPRNKVLLRDFVDVLPLTCFDPRVVSDSELDAFLLTVHSRVLAEDWPPRFSNESKCWFREVFPLCRRDLFILWDRGFIQDARRWGPIAAVPQDDRIQISVDYCLTVAFPVFITDGIYQEIPDQLVASFLRDRLSAWADVIGEDAFSWSTLSVLKTSAYRTYKDRVPSRALVAPNSYHLLGRAAARLYVAPNAGHWKRWYEHITRSQAESGVLGVRDLIYQADGILNGDDELAKSYLRGWIQSVQDK